MSDCCSRGKLGLKRGLALAAGAAVLAAVLACNRDASGGDPEDEAAMRKAAEEAMTKAVERGKELFHTATLGKKSCSTCHENEEKPALNLATRDFHYPAYSRKKKVIVTMTQKVNEMIQNNARGATLDGDSTELAALEAYIASIRSQKK